MTELNTIPKMILNFEHHPADDPQLGHSQREREGSEGHAGIHISPIFH